jgi:hypothetical protein
MRQQPTFKAEGDAARKPGSSALKFLAGASGAGLLDRDAVDALAKGEPTANATAVRAVRTVFQARGPIGLNADALIGLAGNIATVHVGFERDDALIVRGLGFCPLGGGFGHADSFRVVLRRGKIGIFNYCQYTTITAAALVFICAYRYKC